MQVKIKNHNDRMKKYNFVNNLLGWVTFAIAAFVYCSTIEPTASFWDCPEFITTAYKLEVGHPPGAPFFMLTANLFSQFVSDPANVAKMVNTMSALLSAACILFLFWTITHLTRKLLCKDGEEPNLSKLIAIMGSGLVGSLAYTFSDTFWFSAVEGEVYAYSSLFTAAVFWLILKWENHAEEPHSDRWLILIAYLIGLSIGVHLLNLLCIPAIVLVFYYKKNPKADLKGSIFALIISALLIVVVLYGIVPGVVNALFTVRDAGNIQSVMNICAFNEIIVLGHEADKIIRIIDYGISQFAVFLDRLDIRDLAPGPSGKRTDGIFDPYHLKINIVSTLFAEKVHLGRGTLGKYLAGQGNGNRNKCYGQNKCPDDVKEHQLLTYRRKERLSFLHLPIPMLFRIEMKMSKGTPSAD